LKIIEDKFTYKEPFYLESGRVLAKIDLAYSIYGNMNSDKSNIILVCHPLALSHLPVTSNQQKKGWWDKLIGENKAIDTNKFCIICSNALGSDYGSTSPNSIDPNTSKPYKLNFPVVSIRDMINAQKKLLEYLGVHHLAAIVGGSMGAMQALQFLVEYPTMSDIGIVLAGTSKTKDYTIAYNKVIQQSIINDKNFNNGDYDKDEISKNGLSGLSIARMLGHITFLSPYSMQNKFKNEYVNDDGLFELFGNFQVERYLEYNGQNFSKRFDAISYLYLSKAINIFDLSRGHSSLQDALLKIKAKLFLISFKEDRLFAPQEMQELQDECKKLKIDSVYQEIDSDYGHDAFLVEVEKFEHIIKNALK